MDRPLCRFMMRAGAYAAVLAALLLATYYGIDPLHTARGGDSYFTDDFDYNLAVVAIDNFDRSPDRRSYDSFILGNSMSKSLRVADWQRYLPAGARPYHLSSDRQWLPVSIKLLEYVAANVDSVRDVLYFTSMPSLTAEVDDWAIGLPHPRIYHGVERASMWLQHLGQGLNRRMIAGRISAWAGDWAVKGYPHRPGVVFEPGGCQVNYVGQMAYADTASLESEPLRSWQKILAESGPKVEPPLIDAEVESLLYRLKEVADACGARLEVVIVPTAGLHRMSQRDDSVMRAIFGPRFHNLTYARDSEMRDVRNFYDEYHFDSDMAARLLDDALGPGQ